MEKCDFKVLRYVRVAFFPSPEGAACAAYLAAQIDGDSMMARLLLLKRYYVDVEGKQLDEETGVGAIVVVSEDEWEAAQN